MPELKKVIGFVLFASLMLVKVSALHVYTHQDSEKDSVEHCDICDIAIENQTSDVQINPIITIEHSPEIVETTWEPHFDQQLTTIRFNFSLFSRPPPTYLVQP
ncbi:MAG: hypothetical protein AB3N18_01185 [Allomuricauda sp.]